MTGLKAQLKSIEENTSTRLTKVEDKITQLDEGIDTRIDKKVERVKEELFDEVITRVKTNLQDSVRTEVKEIEDQKQRTLNLICFNLEESTSKNNDERKSHDMRKLIELCEGIGVRDPDIKVAFRLGNQNSKTGNTKPRPLKVILNNKRQRKEILDNTSKIKDLPSRTGLNRCIVVKDLTVRQREERKQKREEKRKTSTTNVGKIPAKNEEKVSNDQMDIFYDETIRDSTVMEATVRNIADEEDNMNSQPLLRPLMHFKPASTNISVDTALHVDRLGQVSPFSELGDETIIGGYDTQQPNFLNYSPIRKNHD